MMKIINAFPGMGDPMTEDETRNFMADDNNNLLIRIGLVDEKGEPNVIPLAYYFDNMSNKIYITTHKTSKKVYDLRKKNIVAYCIDDPTPPYKGVRGKGRVKVLEDVDHNIQIVKKFITKRIGSEDHPIAKWLLTETENGNEVILEITPSYYSTWRSAIPAK